MKTFIKYQEKIPHWLNQAQANFGFWDGSLLAETDPPTGDPTPEPEPEKTPEDPTPEPESEPKETGITIEDVMAAIKGLMPVKEEPKPEETPTEDPDPKPEDEEETGIQEELQAFRDMLRETLIEKHNPPEALLEFIPQDPLKAKVFFNSQGYKDLVEKLNLVKAPLKEEPKPEETKTTSNDGSRDPSKENKKKTFEDFDTKALSDILKGVI